MPTTHSRTKAIQKNDTPSVELDGQHPSPLAFTPAADIEDAGSEYILAVDLPGASRDSIEITLEQEFLNLSARVPARDRAGTPRSREYGVGDFRRSFRVGEDIDPDAIGASYIDGVLTIRLPKRKEVQPRRIRVN